MSNRAIFRPGFWILMLIVFGLPTFLLFGVMPDAQTRIEEEKKKIRASSRPATREDLCKKYGLYATADEGDLRWRNVAELIGSDPDITMLTSRLAKNQINDFADMRPTPGERWTDKARAERWLSNREKAISAAIQLIDQSVPLRFPELGSKNDSEVFNQFPYVISKGIRLKLWFAIEENSPERAWIEIFRLWKFAESMKNSPNLGRYCEIGFETTLSTIYGLRCIKLSDANLAKLQPIVARNQFYSLISDLNDVYRIAAMQNFEQALSSPNASFFSRKSALGTLLIERVLEDHAFSSTVFNRTPQEGYNALSERRTSTQKEVKARILAAIDPKNSQRTGLLLPYVANPFVVCDAYTRGLEMCIAIERFRIAQQKLPNSLDEIQPAFISKLATDVYVQKPLCYRKVSDRYWVESVGPNEKHEVENRGDDIRITLDSKRADEDVPLKSVPNK